MIDVIEFNEQYLKAMMERAGGNRRAAAEMFNSDPVQYNEIAQMSASTIHAISKSSVSIAEPTFKLSDLKRRRSDNEAEVDQVVSSLNYSFLSMVRSIANKDGRLAYLTTRTPVELCEALKKMTPQELLEASCANKLMFKCSLVPKSIERANRSGVKSDNDRLYLRHLPLMTLGIGEGVRL